MTNVIYYTKCSNYVAKIYGFFLLRGIGYWRFMGFSVKMPANQVGSLKKSWDFRGYGLSEVWFMGSVANGMARSRKPLSQATILGEPHW
ncbi:hypothetical protein L208DRAFT_1270643 [Tricholoma matsutake]|nr:hypothetical protein L208DRAFT_1270643 [Tricholoma matsutake 945]